MDTMTALFHLGRDAQRHAHGAARGDAGEDALFPRQPARHVLGVGLAHGLDAVDARSVVDSRQVGLGPFADAGNLRAFGRLRSRRSGSPGSFP